ncbi:leucine-rich repeat flightless-interacting protein 1 isoform X20 [Trachypithecus francoisi]|uniref:leucine-rich repeat flightless-interacting protein 1 isoform X20 n=1 Tax=Trachypithecus francoisi TaxID=54180 RepID=UPI00141B4D27|nr:leucine-rich repeat flightless-interacting protein 1 isoform X20 [Trachypithecus francoisi]
MGRAEAPEAPESRFPCALPPPAVLSPAATCAPPLPATPEPSAASLALEGWLLAPEAGALISLRVAPSPRTERAPAGPAREGLPAWSPSVSRRVERAQPGRMTSPAAAQSREIDCLSPEAQRLAEARLAAKRAARAEAREIRMKELERQQKEIYQVQKKYYGLDTKWGDIEQWMEDSERYSRRSRRNTSASDEDERMSVGSRGSLRSQPDLEYGGPYAWTNGYDGELYGSQSLNRRAGRVEDRPEKDFTEKGSRNMPGLSAATLASLGGTSSRRGSGDTSISIDTEASIREIKELNELKDQIQDVEGKYMQGLKEMKDSLAEVEEKYKKAMVSNAQLDNEKTNFMYQVDTLKDMMLELEEQLAESRRQYEEKNKEFEREKHAHSILQFQFAEVKEALKQREEMLEKHGIILNSEIATNGETSDTLNNFGYQGPSKMTKEELNALKSTGDGTLGRASEVEVKNEIVANVGKREILHNTEKEQHTEDTVKDCVDIEVFPAGENTEDQKSSEDTAPFLGTLAGATYEEQVQNQILESTSLPENTAQAESDEVMGAPDDRTRTPLEPSSCWNDLDGGNHTGNVGEAAATQVGEQAGTVASCPLGHSDDTVYHDDKCTVEVPQELETSTGHSLEKEFTNLEAAEPKEVPVQSTEVGRDHNEEEDEETVLRDEKPIKTEVPGSPAGTESNGQEATGPSTVDTQSESLDMKEPEEEKNDQQGEALDSSQKKTKNKKKKNKKKKSPVPVETLKDVKKELTYQNTDLSEIKEEEQVKSTDRKSAVEAQNEAPENPKQKIAAESSENADCPENPKIKLAGKLDQEGDDVKTAAEVVLADGDTLDFEDDTVQSLGPRAGGEELDDGVAKDNAKTDGATQSSPAEPESEDADSCTLPENESPSQDLSDACEAESTERCGMSEHPSQTVRKALDSNSLENDDLSALGGEPGDFNPESREDTREGNEKGKSKEDCTMS